MTKREAREACRWVGSEYRRRNIYIAQDTKLNKYEQFANAVGVLGMDAARACAIAGWTEENRKLGCQRVKLTGHKKGDDHE